MSTYVQYTLKSGREVSVRPMTWNEFWDIGEKRLDMQETSSKATTISAQKQALKEQREFLELPLTLCVESFVENALSSTLSRAEVRELQDIINELSEPEVTLGNSEPAAATTQTPA